MLPYNSHNVAQDVLQLLIDRPRAMYPHDLITLKVFFVFFPKISLTDCSLFNVTYALPLKKEKKMHFLIALLKAQRTW